MRGPTRSGWRRLPILFGSDVVGSWEPDISKEVQNEA